MLLQLLFKLILLGSHLCILLHDALLKGRDHLVLILQPLVLLLQLLALHLNLTVLLIEASLLSLHLGLERFHT